MRDYSHDNYAYTYVCSYVHVSRSGMLITLRNVADILLANGVVFTVRA